MIKFRSNRPEVFCEKVFLEISQYSQENNCVGVSFYKDAGLEFPLSLVALLCMWNIKIPRFFYKG